jgi:type I restriction enzyme S subunit
MSKLLEQINSELETKETVPLANLMSQITSKVNKIQKSDYLKFGLVPIYDQGDNDVSGYSNDVSNAYNGKLPVVIFGDHTLRLKRISSPFFLGADGNQLIEPLDENILDRNYFYYLLLSKKPRSYGYERHFKYLKEVEVKVPNLPTQKKIAKILSAYDEKIENNNLIIKKLEATAQILFDEWFVNFRFPGYEKVKFVDSEMGEIPEGWEVKKLGDLIDVSGGFSYKGEYLSDIKSETLLVTMGNISSNDRFNFNSVRYYNGEFPSKFLLKPGDIALATRDVTQDRAILGAPLVIPELLKNKNVLLATNMYAVKNLSDIDNIFFFHLFRSDSYRERMVTSAKGSNILMLTKDTILDFKFILPARIYIDEYLKVAKNIKITIESCVEENISLKSQRDQLLTRLI